jgi:hypothetical protein
VKELTLEKVLGESSCLNSYVEDCVEWLERRDWIEFRTRGLKGGAGSDVHTRTKIRRQGVPRTLNRNLWRGLPPPSLAHTPPEQWKSAV